MTEILSQRAVKPKTTNQNLSTKHRLIDGPNIKLVDLVVLGLTAL